MAIEHYSLCPCGSGKKIKFCKCADSIGELDRIMKMVNGNQVVAGLDRLNHILKEHPDAAWALAVKGRLLISLGENKSLAENAERFIRLQPSNPLALAQQSIARIFDKDSKGAAESLLQAFAESRSEVDSFLLETASLLAFSLAREGNVLSARLYASLPLGAGDLEQARMAASVLNELNHSPQVNLLLKSLPENKPQPEGVAWSERFEEAISLLYTQQIPAAEAKLEGLDRQYPGEPSILTGLVNCALWKADQVGQARIFGKLANAIKDDPETAARMKALSLLVDPAAAELATEVSTLTAELNDVDEAIAALTASELFDLSPGNQGERFEGMFEVPPKMVFAIFDRPENYGAAPDTLLAPILGTVLVFGRQTDHAPEIKVLDVRAKDRETVESYLKSTLMLSGDFQREVAKVPLHFLLSPRIAPRVKAEFEEAYKEVDELAPKLIVRNVVDAQLTAFEGKSLRQIADDPSTQLLRTAVVRLIEGLEVLRQDAAAIVPDLAAILHVPLRETIVITDEEQLEELAPIDLTVVDVEKLDPPSLLYFFQRSQQSGCRSIAQAAAKRLVDVDPDQLVSDEDSREFTMASMMRAHVELIHGAEGEQELDEISNRAQQWCVSQQLDPAYVVFEDLQASVALGLPERLRSVLTLLTTRHGDNAEIMAMVQQFLMRIGVLNPDGSPRGGMRAAPGGSAILGAGGGAQGQGAGPTAGTPEIIASPNAPAAGAGKLWLPGMD